MTQYIGIKLINGFPMNRLAYTEFRGWQLPDDENGADEGYLVEYLNGKPNTEQYEGYVSWSPKAVFEKAYRPVTGMNFGMALEAAKAGKRISRSGWNVKGQYVRALIPQAPHPDDSPDAVPSNPYFKMWDNNPQAEGTFTTFLILKNAQNKVFPWLPSTGDLMADDWLVVDEALVTDIPPHQLRVLKELEEVSNRLKALNAFIDGGSEIFAKLDLSEQGRLREQATYMADYQDVLIRRVAAFQ